MDGDMDRTAMTDHAPLTDEELAEIEGVAAAIPETATGWMLLFRADVLPLIADLRTARERIKELEADIKWMQEHL